MRRLTLIILTAAISSPMFANGALEDLLQKLSGADYTARQEARDELYSMAADVSASNAEPGSMEAFASSIANALQVEAIDIQGKVFLTRILTRIGSEASVPALVGIAEDPASDPIVREHALMAVSAIPGRNVSDMLIDGLQNADESQKALWWQALQNQADSSMVKSLISEIGSNELSNNPDAWTALGKIGGTEAAKFLFGLLKKVDPANASVIEKAILQSGGCTVSQLKQLMDDSRDVVVKIGAYEQLLDMDAPAALAAIEDILSDQESPIRQLAIRMSLDTGSQQFWELIAANLPKLMTDEVNTFLIAVGEQNKNEYETQVIGYLKDETLIPALHALAEIGTDKSTPVLLEKMHDEDESVQDLAIYALAQVADPGLDRDLIARVRDVQSANREEMIRLIAIRNSDGAIDILNSILMQGANDPAFSQILESIEEIGDINSCQILVSRILDNPASSDLRKYQLTLKRLVIRLSIPDHLWENTFYPALLLASSDAMRGNIIEILDCLSVRGALDYCVKCLKSDNSEVVQQAAMAAVRRWTDLNVSAYWIDVLRDNDSTLKELKDARTALARTISSNSVSGNTRDKAALALKILLEFDDEELRDQVLNALNSNNGLGRDFTNRLDPYRSIIEAWDKLN